MFKITAEDSDKIDSWLHETVYPPLIQMVKDKSAEHTLFTDHKGRKIPPLGASGGSLTYSFTPTSLGTIVEVIFAQDTPYEQTLDLTEYRLW